MKFSENWLRQHVRTDATREQLAATLTAIGLEVEELTPLGEALEGVVVARIISTARHPEADRLQVCRVDAGNGALLQIVCGAPNARPGLVAPLATIGTRIGDITIKAAKLRGVESNGTTSLSHAAATSKAMPRTLKQSARLGVSFNSMLASGNPR